MRAHDRSPPERPSRYRFSGPMSDLPWLERPPPTRTPPLLLHERAFLPSPELPPTRLPPTRPSPTGSPPPFLHGRPFLPSPEPRALHLPPRPPSRKRHLVRSFAVLCLVNFLCALDGSILSVALPHITKDLRGSAFEAFWAGTSFLLASAVLQPLWAELSDIGGQKSTLLAALLLFTLGSVLAVASTSFALLLVGRVVQGVGVGGLVALTYVIVTHLVSLQERGKWFGLISFQWALGSTIAPLIGGALAQNANWRWIFGINFPFYALALVAAQFFLRLEARPPGAARKLARLDWRGFFLMMSSLTVFLVLLTWGGIMYDWTAAATIVPLVLGFALVICFVLYNTFVSKRPVIRKSLFAAATGKAAYASALIHGMLVYCLVFYLPLYFQGVQGYSAILSGAALLPFSLATGSLAIGTGVLISKDLQYRARILIGSIAGIGLGTVWSAGSFTVQAPASTADAPFAASTFVFIRALGQTLGVAVGGTIFQNTFKSKLGEDARYAPYAA
ncbi:major facilitator superfamily domain-containing protein [Apiospora phragmitis]|uniref:Major facilitator superfamily domain-containing protein n=1 Tax=Apiospora phragmitis TaxID=2905665 RepID=A0ABR1VQ58_9PEZI